MSKVPRSRGFTLVELMVSIGILSFLVLLLMGITNAVSSHWVEGQSRNERRGNGRAILDFMARELQLAQLATSGPERIDYATTPPTYSTQTFQFVASVAASQSSANPTFIPDEYLNPHALFWQAADARVTTRGRISEIGYFVKWNGDKPVLVRFQADPADPNDTANLNLNFKIFDRDQSNNPVNWLEKSVIDAVAPASSPAERGWFAEGVIGLWVRSLDDQGRAISTDNSSSPATVKYQFDSRRGYRDAAGVGHGPPALPSAIEIALVLVDARTAQRFQNGDASIVQGLARANSSDPANMMAPAGSGDGVASFVQDLPPRIRQGARIYSTTIQIPASK